MRNLVVLSDGTGNSAAASNKTNVWRIYEALDLTGADQIATFGDGVGTSKSKPMQLLGHWTFCLPTVRRLRSAL
ncbi:MAG: phospholipase effector Tle1 domain-containing protein [Bradyrhizobium sp.]